MNDGGAAFPVPINKVLHDTCPSDFAETGCGGMSLRDWFAGMALKGLLSNPEAIKALISENGLRLDHAGFKRIAQSSMVAADARLTARQASKETK